jgi:hypothetical protein
MDVEGQGVTTESPAVTETPTEPTAQAPSQPGNTGNGQGQPQPRMIPLDSHIAERRSLQSRIEAAERRAQDFERQLQAASQPKPAPLPIEQRIEREQAVEALRELIGGDPKLKHLLDLADKAPDLMTGYQNVQQLSQHQLRSVLTNGDERVASLAKAAGLPDTPEFVKQTQGMVAAVISLNPQAREALRQGDLSVVDRAFDVVKGFVEPLRRSQVANLATTKTAAAAIPTPARNGGPPGPAAPPKVTAANEPEVREGIRERIRAAFGQLRE